MGNETSQASDPQQQQGADGGAGPALPGAGYQNLGNAPSVAGHQSAAARQPGAAAPGAVRPNTAAGTAAAGDSGEGLLLSQLVQLLHQRPRQSLLLSDLGALLPQHLRSSVKEKGGLRSWLQKHPMLFSVSGQPGKESVTLTLGGGGEAAPAGGQAVQDAPAAGENQISQMEMDKKDDDDDEETASCVQMRGLPYRATSQDVKIFLNKHSAHLKDDQSVQLVLNRDGRPSGFARVQFTSPAAARAARDELHNAVMRTADGGNYSQDRYVEIFLYSERPNKLRFRKGLATADGQMSALAHDEPDTTTKEQVIQECREHMASPGKAQLLLSMLGVALSPASRLLLKKTDLGLKHFLSQYPAEFRVEGVKGRENITYLPAMPKSAYSAPMPQPQVFAAQPQLTPEQQQQQLKDRRGGKGASKGTVNGPATGNLRSATPQLEDNPGLRSPGLTPVSPGFAAGRGLRTPSDWGTPQANDLEWEQRPRPDRQAAEAAQAAGPMDFMNSFDPNTSWAAWGMPPPAAYMQAGMPPLAGMAPPWGSLPPGMAGQPPPWMLDPSLGGIGRPGLAGSSPFFAGMGMTAPAGIGAQSAAANDAAAQPDASGDGSHTLFLRGLPFTCSEQEIYAFFSKHDVVEHIADVNKAVQFISKPNGKPSGQATVQMASKEQSDIAQQALNGQWIGTRYIEVFPYTKDSAIEAGSDAEVPTASTDVPPSAGDTGGSGSPGSGLPQNAVPWQQAPWGDGRDAQLETLMQMAALRQAGMGMPPMAGMPPMMNLPAPTDTGGDASEQVGMPGGPSGESWGLLFDFLKRDGGAASADGNPAHVHVNPI